MVMTLWYLLVPTLLGCTSALQTCLEDSIPITAETADTVRQILDKLDGNGLVSQSHFISWGPQHETRAAFLPAGSRLYGSKQSAEAQLRKNGTVAFTRPKLKNLRGLDVPLRIDHGNWASVRMVSSIFSILLQDIFCIRLATPLNSTRSEDGLRAIAGCPLDVNEACSLEGVQSPRAHIYLEAWDSDKTVVALDADIRPLSQGIWAYLGVEGTFLRSDVVALQHHMGHLPLPGCRSPKNNSTVQSCEDALLALRHLGKDHNLTFPGPSLEFYRTYNVSNFPDTNTNFDNLTYAISRINMSDATSCEELGRRNPLIANYAKHISDPDGWQLVNQVACGNSCHNRSKIVAPRCTDSGKVWRSPACREAPQRCIPFLTTDAYAVHIAMQQAFYWQEPLAIIDLARPAWIDALLKLRVLGYWWQPDPTFVHLTQVLMPVQNKVEHADGLYRSGYSTTELSKYVWRGLPEAEPTAFKLARDFNIRQHQMDALMYDFHHSLEHDASGESDFIFNSACTWVIKNLASWSAWVPKECKIGEGLSNENGCSTCTPGYYGDGSTCIPCEAGKYGGGYGALKCEACSAGKVSLRGSADCDPEGAHIQVKDYSLVWLLSIIIIILVGIALAVLFVLRRRWTTVLLDNPSKAETTSGEWVHKWAGPHAHMRLIEAADPFAGVKFGSHNSSMSSHSMRKAAVTESLKNSAGAWCPNVARRFNLPDWIVNTSPFTVVIELENCRAIQLASNEFCKGRGLKRSRRHDMTMSFETDEGNQTLKDWVPRVNVSYVLRDSDWETRQSSKCHTVRKPLPKVPGEDATGEIKLVCRQEKSVVRSGVRGCLQKSMAVHGEVLLIMWSPPHIHRGIPVAEFFHFLDSVINTSGVWYGRSNEPGTPRDAPKIEKKGRERTMHDANNYIVKVKAASRDASYAEIFTDYGPPSIFISHVWTETADATRQSLIKLREVIGEAALGSLWRLARHSPKATESINRLSWLRPSSSNNSMERELDKIKLWFCTTCNNQSRIDEELGSSILSSPFAQVVSHSTVKTVALISPMKALGRKWCTFEFSLALNAGKDTLLVTRDGVVQAGQVPPIFLKELSECLVEFDSEKASVSTVKDGIMIDEAVADMGGFNVINEQVIHIFRKAIDEAHMCTEYARDLLDSARCSLDEAVVSRSLTRKSGERTARSLTTQSSAGGQLNCQDPEQEVKKIICSL